MIHSFTCIIFTKEHLCLAFSMSFSFRVCAVSSNSLAMTNCVFLSQEDFAAVQSEDEVTYLRFPDGFIYPVRADDSVEDGCIALNKLQRGLSEATSTGEDVSVQIWSLPDNLKSVLLTHLIVEIDLLGKNPATVDEDKLAAYMREKLVELVFRKNQVYFLNFGGAALKITVLGASVAGLAANGYGFLTKSTFVKVHVGEGAKNLTFISSKLESARASKIDDFPIISNSNATIYSDPFDPVEKKGGSALSAAPTIVEVKQNNVFGILPTDNSLDLLAKLGELESITKQLRSLIVKPDALAVARKSAVEADLALLKMGIVDEEKKQKLRLESEAKLAQENLQKELQTLRSAAEKEIEKLKSDAAAEIKKLKDAARAEIREMQKKAQQSQADDGVALM